MKCIVAALALLCVSRVASAQTTNYQNRLLGQRAIGMGGAFTAIADDPSAAYYNPAALSNLSTLQLEVGLPVIGIDLHRIIGGLVPGAKADVNALQALALPTMVGAAAGVGPKDETGNEIVTLAASIMIPWQRNVAWKETVQSDTTSAFHLVQDNEQTTMIGGSISARLGPVSFGASLYYVHQNVQWLNARSGTGSVCDSTGCKLQTAYNLSSLLEAWSGSLNPRLGMLIKINPKFSVGVMASLSSYRMFGTGGIKTGIYGLNNAGAAFQAAYQSDALFFNRPMPWEIRVGVGYKPNDRSTLAIDTTLYMPDRFTMISGIDPQYSIYPSAVRRGTIANVNIGFEYYVQPKIPLRFGLFTNLSSAPAVIPAATSQCDSTACLDWMHQGGVTTSVGFTLWRVAMDLGINAVYGRGYRQQITDAVAHQYRWSENEAVLLQIFIGGNLGKVLGETAVELKNELERQAASKPFSK